MATTATKPNTSILSKLKEAIKRRADIPNLVLLVLLGTLVLLSFNRGLFGGAGGHNFEILISAVITGVVAALAIVVPLRLQKQSATKTLTMVVSSELYRNLSELEYADQQLKKDYNEEPPTAGTASPRGRQSMEMGKIMGMAARLDAALEDAGYSGMMSSRIIADIKQPVAQAIIEAYSGIASVQKTARHFADFFDNMFKMEQAGINPAVTEYSRKHRVDQAIQIVKEDVCVAIGQVNAAVKTMKREAKYYKQGFEPVYRDVLVEKYGCAKKGVK